MATARPFRFVPDEAGIFEVTSSEEVAPLLTERARAAADEVRKLAPSKRSSFFDYRRRVRARAARRTPRGMEAAVEVDSPGWHLPEYGTATIPATAPLRRGIPLAGLDFREGDS